MGQSGAGYELASDTHALSGQEHSASGLSAGQVLRASGASTFAWAALSHADLGVVGADDHHATNHADAQHSDGPNAKLAANTFTGVQLGPAGSQTAPTWAFSGDPDTGMFSDAANTLKFATAGVNRVQISASGHIQFAADNAQDIGGAGSLRPRDLNLGRNAVIGGALDHDGTTVGFYGVAPAARPSAYTQTYATAARAHAQAAVATTGATNVTPFGYTTAAQANAIPTAINELKDLINSIIDDHQANGMFQ